MGLGDVKLAGLIGLVLGAMDLRLVAVAAMLGFVAGGWVPWWRSRWAATARRSSFGPYMALGAALAVFFGTGIADWYTGLLH